MNVQVEVQSLSKKLLILDINRVLLFSVNILTQVEQTRGVRVGNKLIFLRPYLHEFLQYCKSKKLDVALWSCMQPKNIYPKLQVVLNHEEQQTLCFVATQEDVIQDGFHGGKPTFLKVLERLKYDKKYLKENVILVDDSAYKTSINPFYSSLYPPQYVGQEDDDFLEKTFIPYLDRILNSDITMHQFIKENYPHWSETSLQRDWRENMSIWRNTLYIHMKGDAEHLMKYHDFIHDSIIHGKLHRHVDSYCKPWCTLH